MNGDEDRDFHRSLRNLGTVDLDDLVDILSETGAHITRMGEGSAGRREGAVGIVHQRAAGVGLLRVVRREDLIERHDLVRATHVHHEEAVSVEIVGRVPVELDSELCTLAQVELEGLARSVTRLCEREIQCHVLCSSFDFGSYVRTSGLRTTDLLVLLARGKSRKFLTRIAKLGTRFTHLLL